MNNDLTIFVNTSDNFEDCWRPFFTLFSLYWPNCPFPIVLNTEIKDFHFDGLNIQCTKVAVGENRRLTWSECLQRGLDAINTPFILYLQEDYFLERQVHEDKLVYFLQVLRNNNADVIRIMECGGSGPWQQTEYPNLWAVDQHAKYRIALQAALWRKSVLRSYIRLHESPWQLEIFGSKRASRKKHKVYCVNRDLYSNPENEILYYIPTGVVSGKWEEKIVVPLFAKHGITVDFSKRGFYDKNAKAVKKSILSRIYDRVRSLL